MATVNADTAKTAAATPPSFFPDLINTEWLKPWTDAPRQSYIEALSFAAKRLHAQADFIQALARCETPTDVWKYQAEYLQNLLGEYSQECAKTFKTVQDSVANASREKRTG